ncbi:hypothetical protein [Photobacterium kishitanii]|uniref:Uncharacterized protein n=1 Tax=Photobacterium kishitanii TaxID=318456 RepID=A0A2T3KLK5_9GAMM|nr:hypothetical protein [Photobacterium kishitanii]PSV00527.1 hypothetical protein C9J27_05175 [Photobacterium kishitanii]
MVDLESFDRIFVVYSLVDTSDENAKEPQKFIDKDITEIWKNKCSVIDVEFDKICGSLSDKTLAEIKSLSKPLSFIASNNKTSAKVVTRLYGLTGYFDINGRQPDSLERFWDRGLVDSIRSVKVLDDLIDTENLDHYSMGMRDWVSAVRDKSAFGRRLDYDIYISLLAFQVRVVVPFEGSLHMLESMCEAETEVAVVGDYSEFITNYHGRLGCPHDYHLSFDHYMLNIDKIIADIEAGKILGIVPDFDLNNEFFPPVSKLTIESSKSAKEALLKTMSSDELSKQIVIVRGFWGALAGAEWLPTDVYVTGFLGLPVDYDDLDEIARENIRLEKLGTDGFV